MLSDAEFAALAMVIQRAPILITERACLDAIMAKLQPKQPEAKAE